MQTVRRSLSEEDRGMGNSVLQSGASIGAILTPIIIGWMIPLAANGQLSTEPGLWRKPFFIFGAIGFLWVVGWLSTVRGRDLLAPSEPAEESSVTLSVDLARLLRSSRFWTQVIVVIAINTTWQIFRAWLPKILQDGRGFPEKKVLDFIPLYYIATDIGCIAAGLATKWLASGGRGVFDSRRMTYTLSAVVCASIVAVPWMPSGPSLFALWLIAGAGALGVFPCYYSFVQSLSERHPAKVFGILSCTAWLATSPMHWLLGVLVDAMIKADVTRPFDRVMVVVGLLPLLAAAPLWFLWKNSTDRAEDSGRTPT
jgi:ACS family hexuronate transporter-like MFS transporter